MIRYGLLLLLLFSNFSAAEELTLPVAKDFLMDSQKVWKQKTPILIMFSIPGCGYCKKIKEDVLSPMAEMPEYQKKIIIRHIFIMKKSLIMSLPLSTRLTFSQP